MGNSVQETPMSTLMSTIRCVIVVGLLFVLCLTAEIVRFVCGLVGIRFLCLENPNLAVDYNPDTDDDEWSEFLPSERNMEDIKSQMQLIRYETLCGAQSKQEDHVCAVCLTEFDLDENVHHLSCGHIFHEMCIEKWLKRGKVTCPLCRSTVVNLQDLGPGF